MSAVKMMMMMTIVIVAVSLIAGALYDEEACASRAGALLAEAAGVDHDEDDEAKS